MPADKPLTILSKDRPVSLMSSVKVNLLLKQKRVTSWVHSSSGVYLSRKSLGSPANKGHTVKSCCDYLSTVTYRGDKGGSKGRRP
jgi:hypothetical protein